MSKMTKKPITGVNEIIDELASIVSLLREIISYNYPEKTKDVEKSIWEAKHQLVDMSELKNCFGKGLKLVLVPIKDFNKFVESKKVIYDLNTDYCKFVVFPESGICVISVRGY